MSDILEIELRISEGNAEAVLGKARKSLEDFVKETTSKSPTLKFKVAGESFIDLDKLEKRAEQTRKSFEEITRARLDKGQIGFLTQELARTSERARTLQGDISNIKKELANPNRKSSIAFLTDELKAAEREAERLNRKLSALPASSSPTGGRGTSPKSGGRGRITDAQATFLEFADDFAPEGLNRAFNAAGRAVFAAQNIKDSAKEMSLLSGISITTLATFGAIAAVGYGIVKVTQNIREEAERRLKVEELIVGTVNRQILGQKEALKNLKELREEAEHSREFTRGLQTNAVDELKRRRDFLEQLQKITPATLPTLENGKVVSKVNPLFERNSQEILSLDTRIDEVPRQKNALAAKAFDERWESFKKNQEKAIEAEKKFEEASKKRLEDIDKAKEKVKELGKTYNDVADSLFLKVNSQNPFVSLFTEADKSARLLRETTRGLSKDVISTFEQMEQKANAFKLLEAQIENKLSVFDLKSDASNFRSPFDSTKQKKEQDEFVQRFIRNNPNYLFLQNKSEVDDEERAKILKRFAPSSLIETEKDRFNKRLSEQSELLYKPRQSEDELGLADKKFIARTSGVNPLDLTGGLREQAAVAREREAVRLEKQEQEAKIERGEDRKLRERLAKAIEELAKVAGKGGTKAIENIIRIVDETNGTVKLQKSATSKDTQKAYSGGTFFDEYHNQ